MKFVPSSFWTYRFALLKLFFYGPAWLLFHAASKHPRARALCIAMHTCFLKKACSAYGTALYVRFLAGMQDGTKNAKRKKTETRTAAMVRPL